MPPHFKYRITLTHQSNQPCNYQHSRIQNRKSTAAMSASDWLQIKLSITTLPSVLQTLCSIVGFNCTVKALGQEICHTGMCDKYNIVPQKPKVPNVSYSYWIVFSNSRIERCGSVTTMFT